ncbi:MAG: sulfatase-like hydrolase/transferase [Selenomonadaceae bacterium]|nr:sulfatase-like hydrolase/transferase [Selenomonadaceae bacterium]
MDITELTGGEALFYGLQQDIKMAILAPALCAIFRLIFIKMHGGKALSEWDSSQLKESFCYGFWWGMDFNAYPYLLSFVAVTLPAVFLSSWYECGDTVRIVIGSFYGILLYSAFMGRLIFYYHYHDVYNRTLFMGKHADKGNLLDIFFNQNHGAWILLGIIPFTALCVGAESILLSLPSIPAIVVDNQWVQYIINFIVFAVGVLLYYWFHFGGTLKHRDKPEWDELPQIIKKDIFLAKATMDDFVAIKQARKFSVPEFLLHEDNESEEIIRAAIPELKNIENKADFNPLSAFYRHASGAKIKKPKRIFLVYGESHAQSLFDSPYDYLNVMEASKKFRSDEHTYSINNFLSGGLLSQISLGSLLLGTYDSDVEINERTEFWHATTPMAMARQLKKLGYNTHFWYGGKLTWGSLLHFCPAAGFDECHGGPDICPPDSPSTWLGVYDHIFLDSVAQMIKNSNNEYEVHFIYTTSNHGPYDMPYGEYGFDANKIMPNIPEALKNSEMDMRRFAGVWYSDQYINKFIDEMKEQYPDSLVIVTGDHASQLIPYDKEIIPRTEQMLRETMLPCFHIYHKDLTADMLANNKIGSHMNIPATIIELIAEKGFEYCSLFPSLTEKLDHVVSPYCWMTENEIGVYRDKTSQQLETSAENKTINVGKVLYEAERNAWQEITGWILRHPEVLQNK